MKMEVFLIHLCVPYDPAHQFFFIRLDFQTINSYNIRISDSKFQHLNITH